MEITNNMEIFKDIIKFENTYQISNFGNVRNKKTGLLLKPQYNKKGYKYVYLSYSHTGRVKWYIHRLVATHFIQNPESKPQVNHIDGNKSNNHADNLEWCTNDENQRHAVLNNLHYQGESHKDSKFTEDSVKLLPKLINIGFSISQINKLTGVAHVNIEKIINGKSWRQLGLIFGRVRKAKSWDKFQIKISEELYIECVKFWGNTVLNEMIAKGNLLIEASHQCNA